MLEFKVVMTSSTVSRSYGCKNAIQYIPEHIHWFRLHPPCSVSIRQEFLSEYFTVPGDTRG